MDYINYIILYKLLYTINYYNGLYKLESFTHFFNY